MIIQAPYTDRHTQTELLSSPQDEAINGLQASLRSSASLRAILTCARERRRHAELSQAQIGEIESIHSCYEAHHQAVRDHCLDYFNAPLHQRQEEGMHQRTVALVQEGKRLFQLLREAILTC